MRKISWLARTFGIVKKSSCDCDVNIKNNPGTSTSERIRVLGMGKVICRGPYMGAQLLCYNGERRPKRLEHSGWGAK